MTVSIDDAVSGNSNILGVFRVDRRLRADPGDPFEVSHDQGIFLRILVEQYHGVILQMEFHIGIEPDRTCEPDPVRDNDFSAFFCRCFYSFPERIGVGSAPVSDGAVSSQIKFLLGDCRDIYRKRLKHNDTSLLNSR